MQHQRTFFKLICCEPANWPCLVFKTRLHPGLLLASRPGAKNDDCSVGTFVKLMWVHPLWSLQTGHSAGGKKHAAWGKARCSWFWHLSAESPKWFQWCQLDGMFNFAWVAGLRILLGFLGGGAGRPKKCTTLGNILAQKVQFQCAQKRFVGKGRNNCKSEN